MKMRHRNLIAAVVIIALGVGYAVLTSQLPTRTLQNSTQPSFFPWIITVCLFIFSAALLIQSLLTQHAEDEPATESRSRLRIIWILSFAGYLVVLPDLGFVVANIIFFATLMVLYGARNPLIVAPSSIGLSLLIFLLFRNVFQIRLPAGIIEGWI